MADSEKFSRVWVVVVSPSVMKKAENGGGG